MVKDTITEHSGSFSIVRFNMVPSLLPRHVQDIDPGSFGKYLTQYSFQLVKMPVKSLIYNSYNIFLLFSIKLVTSLSVKYSD